MTKSNKIIIGVIIVVIIIGGIWYGVSRKPTEEVIKIGAIFPLTGDAVVYGVPLQRAAELAVAEINERGGINGKSLEIIWEDGKCNGKDAATAASKLINVDKVKIILGGVCSGETLGAASIVEANKVIMFSSSATGPQITEAGDFIFRNSPSDLTQGKILAEAAWDLGYKKIVVIQEITDYALGFREAFEESFTALGGEVTTETFTTDTTDVRTQLTKLKQAKGDALLVSVQTLPKAEIVVKQIGELDMNLHLLVIDIAIDYQKILDQYPDIIEGAIGAKVALPDPELFEEKVGSKYREKYGEEPTLPEYMALTYDAVFILKEAIEYSISEVGEIDTNKVRDYLYAIEHRKGVGGVLTMDENGDPVAGHILKQVKDGKVINY